MSANDPSAAGKFELTSSRQLPQWLAEQRLSLAFTTYQAGKLFLIGLTPQGRLSIFERTFNRCMGLAGDGQTLWMSTLYQLWRLENTLPPGQLAEGYDCFYIPRTAYTTGDLDIHDIGLGPEGKPVFVATLFGCVATLSETHSIRPLWKPPFISRLAAEDRCHLHGLAMEGGRPRYASAVSSSDVADGWRDRRRDGGLVIDIDTDEIVLTGLSMPHSPRLVDGVLYLADSGTGRFGRVDLAKGAFEEIAFCPGYIRGLTIHRHFAVVGLSMPRNNKTFSDLALDGELKRRNVEPRCGLLVIDLRSGDIVHWIRLEGVVQELYDVVVLPGVTRPMALGLVSDEIRRTISLENDLSATVPR
ncbi:MAG: TIGR03032 family protein [Candidatus Latescibacteria bacterium]|nr:TIGR03032 family protein [Candidatus Latescibacterota bacterium]